MMHNAGRFLWACLITVEGVFVNKLDETFTFTCPAWQGISRVYSVHNDRDEDRQFDFTCRPVVTDTDGLKETCFWTDFVNQYDQLVHYSCPTINYIAGVSSIHSNSNEDRIFKFRCCSSPTIHMEDCDFSGWNNAFDGVSDFTADAGKVLKGIISQHNNDHEDRQFDYETCVVKRPEMVLVG